MTRSKGIFACALIFVLAFAVCFAVAGADGEAMAQPKGNDAYWSESNAPVFYGATGIKLSKNAISEFDIKDSRFRLFAKDFEDGDLESAIQCSGAQDVKPDEPGTYVLHYSVRDSHGNKTAVFTFTVRILEDDATKDGLSALGIGLICAAVAAVLIATALVAIFALKGKKKEKAAR